MKAMVGIFKIEKKILVQKLKVFLRINENFGKPLLAQISWVYQFYHWQFHHVQNYDSVKCNLCLFPLSTGPHVQCLRTILLWPCSTQIPWSGKSLKHSILTVFRVLILCMMFAG